MAHSPPGKGGSDITAENVTGGMTAQTECVQILNSLELDWSQFRAFLLGVRSNPEAYSGCMLYANAGTIKVPEKGRIAAGQNVRAGT